jgi:glutamate-5-semialdehyde dehydrogenase
VSLIHQSLEENNLPTDLVQLLPIDRVFVKELLLADKYVDIIIPRGSQELINFVREHSKVPTIETGAGVCHTYVESSANLENAAKIVVNAKTQRPSVCNSLDTVLVDQSVAAEFLPLLIEGFNEFKVEVFADETSYSILSKAGYPYLEKANEESFGMEYLSQKCSIKVVEGLEEALNHIQKFSSKHSEAIITQNNEFAEKFLNDVDAAAVYVNASTRFTDGGVFGLGAEIGISTQKLHARGPFALEKLTTEKWICRGEGQIR